MRSHETITVPILLLVVFALVVAAGYIPEETLGLNDNPYLAVVIIQLVTYAAPSLFYCQIRGKELRPHLRLRLFSLSQILFIIYAALFLVSGTALVSMGMYALTPESFASSSMREYASFAMNGRVFDGVYLVVAFAFLPAITEEWLFRGIVIGEYEKRGVVLASLFSAVTFSMSHFSLARFPVYLFSGVVLAVVLYTTRSLFASVLLHTLYNASVLLLEPYVLRLVDRQNVSLTLLLILLGAVAILTGMLMCLESSHIYKNYSESNVESSYAEVKKKDVFSRIAEIFFSPAFLVLVVFFVTMAMVLD